MSKKHKSLEEHILLEKPQDTLTKLETETKAKEEVGALEEVLDATGQENEEAAVKWVIEENQKEEAESDAVSNDQAEYFESLSKKGQVVTYSSALAKLLYNILNNFVEWPNRKDYHFYVGYSTLKLGVTVWCPRGKFGRGFTITGQRKYDLNAINVLIMQVENTIDTCIPKVESPVSIENHE